MKYNRIAIVKLSSLGDIVHTLPALSLLRSEFPQAEISWFAEPPGAKLLENFSGIDKIVSVDIKSGSIFKRFGNLKTILSLHRGNFDAVFDFQGLIKSAVLSRLIGKFTIGFHRSNLKESVSRLFYFKTASPFNEREHIIHKNLHLLRVAGLIPENISYPLKEYGHSPEVKNFLNENNLETGKYVILNIGGGWDSKLLSGKQYLEILNNMDPGKKKVVLWGNSDEERRANEIVAGSGAVKSPFLNFSDLILFIKGSEVIISADSLPLHIADITETRSVGIFGPTSPQRNGSLNKESISVVNEVDCSFCYKRTCEHKKCLSNPDLSRISDFINKK